MTQVNPAEPQTVPAAGGAPTSAADEPRVAPGASVSLDGAVEAVLLTSDRPTTVARLVEALAAGGVSCDAGAVKQAVDRLNDAYDRTGRAFRIEAVAGGLRLVTRAEFGPVLMAAQGARESHKLSRAGVETLAIVAYRQPLTRARLEAIRGVACGEVLRTLLEHRLIDIVGRAEELGRPMLYGTTRRFLDVFGLASIRDLPPLGEEQGERKAGREDPRAEQAAENPTVEVRADAVAATLGENRTNA